MYQSILLAIDLNDENSWRKALPTAVTYARTFGARLNIVTVVPEFGMVRQFFPNDYEEELKTSVKAQLKAFTKEHVLEDVAVRRIVAHGTIYEEVIKASDKVEADLIIMASHRPELSDYLLGPNAARVVRHSRRSVLVVR
ncbi:MAG: universal stress protein [Gammaproteobacteria bacterium]|nr:universal stress protein [Gammaproteobacteria bacterium]